jgi:hypothetical protein
VLTGGGTALLHRFRRERLSERWLVTFGGVFLAMQITVSILVLPALNPVKVPAQAAAEVRQRLDPGRPVYLYRQQLGIFPLYAERPGREIHSLEELERVMAAERRGVFVIRERPWEEVRPHLSSVQFAAHPFTMGHKQLLWVEFTADSD